MPPGFSGPIGEPVAIGREGWPVFAESAVHERLRLSGFPAGLFVAFDGKSHDVPIRVRVILLEGQELARQKSPATLCPAGRLAGDSPDALP